MSWPEAEQKTERGVTLLTACFAEKLGDFSSLGLISLTVFSICGFTDVVPNTAVARSTLTHPMRMLTFATC